jgi:Flp pilus assembly protein TadD
MRAFPVAALLLLAACASQAELGIGTGQPGVDVAEAALRGGSPQVALQIDNAILAKDPRNVPALLNRGDVLTAQQQLDQAADSYSDALRFDTNSVPARIGLGRLRLVDNADAAEHLFLEALQRDSRNAVAWNDLGIARDLLGRHEDAQTAYRQAMGIDPTMVGARVNLALSLAMAGRADDAAPMLRPLAGAPTAPRKFRHDLAAVLAMGGERDEAQRILAKDMSPEQVNEALAIFTAASPTPAGAPPTDMLQAPVQSQSKGRAGGIMVQLGSAVSRESAKAKWQALKEEMPELMTNRHPTLARGETHDGREFWRVRTGGFANKEEADSFCSAVKAKGAACRVIGS